MRQVHISAVDNGFVIASPGVGPLQTPMGVMYEPPRNHVAHSIEEAFVIARQLLTGEPAPVPEVFREKPDA